MGLDPHIIVDSVLSISVLIHHGSSFQGVWCLAFLCRFFGFLGLCFQRTIRDEPLVQMEKHGIISCQCDHLLKEFALVYRGDLLVKVDQKVDQLIEWSQDRAAINIKTYNILYVLNLI